MRNGQNILCSHPVMDFAFNLETFSLIQDPGRTFFKVQYFPLMLLPNLDPIRTGNHSIFRNPQKNSYTVEFWTNHALTRQAKKNIPRIRDPGWKKIRLRKQNSTAFYLAEHDYEARLRLVHHPPELGASARVWSAYRKRESNFEPNKI